MIMLGWTKSGSNLFFYLMALWMLLTMLYMLVEPYRRQREGISLIEHCLEILITLLLRPTYQGTNIPIECRWNKPSILILLLLSFLGKWKRDLGDCFSIDLFFNWLFLKWLGA